MRPLQILTNRFTVQKQDLEYQLESELNSQYPSVSKLDTLIEQLTLLESKNGYLTSLLLNISHANNSNDINSQPTE